MPGTLEQLSFVVSICGLGPNLRNAQAHAEMSVHDLMSCICMYMYVYVCICIYIYIYAYFLCTQGPKHKEGPLCVGSPCRRDYGILGSILGA